MKSTWVSGRVRAALIAGFLSVGVSLAGCSDDDVDQVAGPGSSPITVTDILFNPKAVNPGDTLLVTAVVTSSSPNVGDFVSYTWQATGGEWVDALSLNRSTVLWQAPADRNGIFGFTVTASNSAGSSTLSNEVFVGSREDFIDQQAGQMYTLPSGTGLFYTSAPGNPEDGLVLRFKDGATDEVWFPGHLGRHYSFDKDRKREAHTFVERGLYVRTIVVLDDLVAGTQTTVARDNRDFATRWSVFSRPGVSPDGRWISYQGGLLDQVLTPVEGGVDTFAVFVYDVQSQSTTRGTFKGYSTRDSVSNSFYPTISSDNQHVVFISDRGGKDIWEYYALPIGAGGVVADTVPGALIRLTDTGGAITSGIDSPAAVALRAWNPSPAQPILASVGRDKKLRMIRTGGAATTVNVEGDVTDIFWSPDGQYLVASVSGADGVNRVYRIPAVGDDHRVLWEARAGDRISELSISPGGQVVVYANRRGQSVWYELVGTDRMPGDARAVRITGAWTPGGAADYGAPLQSLRPAWKQTGRVAYLFFLDEATPRVISLDLSTVGPLMSPQ